MHTFLTPDPITVEIRNATGEIRVDLADVAATTVDVNTSVSHPFGFLDDIFRAVATKGAQFAGDRKVFAGGRSRSEEQGFGPEPTDEPEDPVDRVRIDLRQPADGKGAPTLIVDTDPARTGWKSAFTVHVTVPTRSGVRIQSQAADVTVVGVADRLETRTASGEVSVDQVIGRCVVQTASGDVSIAAGGDCDLRTASGGITVGTVSGSAQAQSTSGDIEIGTPAGNVNARTVSGEITVRDLVSGRTELTSVSGDVEVGVHAGTLTAVTVTTISGNTESDFDVSDEMPGAAADGSAVPAEDPLDVAAEAWGTDPIDLDLGEPRTDAVPAAAEPEHQPLVQDEQTLDLRIKTTSGDVRLRRAALL